MIFFVDPSGTTGTTSSCSSKDKKPSMKLFNLYSNFTAEPDTRCKEAKGYCMDASSCPRGNYTDNMCPGDASNKCCLAAPFDEPPCEDAGGRCLDECGCTGEVRTGLCGSQPA